MRQDVAILIGEAKMIDKERFHLKMCIERFCKEEDSQEIGRLLQGSYYLLAEYKEKNNLRTGQALVNMVSCDGSYSALYNCEDDGLVIQLIAEELWN